MVSGATTEEQSQQRRLEQEIRDMISTLTHHLTSLGKSAARSDSSRHQETVEADQGVRIVTLAGDNQGATMKADRGQVMDTHGVLYGEEKMMRAIANSNYQAVNNSILLEGRCITEDPGVHIVISEYLDNDDDDDMKVGGKKEKKGKEGWSERKNHLEEQGEKQRERESD